MGKPAIIMLSFLSLPSAAFATEFLKAMPGPGTLAPGQVAYVDDGTCPQGQILEVTGAQSKKEARKRQCIAMPAVSAPATASETPAASTQLSVDDIKTTLIGKKVLLSNANKSQISWDIRSDGSVYGRNLSSGFSSSATWTFNDQGLLCVKWNDLRSYSGCMSVRKTGGQIQDLEFKLDNGETRQVLSIE